ncbi:MAG: hypothetical protein R6V20_00585 [Desulfobia sp.]
MYKKAAFVLLTLFLIFLIRDVVATWQKSYDFFPSLREKNTVTHGKAVQKADFYPPLPDPLPDLTENYLFNKQRRLETEGEGSQKKSQGAVISMEGLIYRGSIITGASRKALVSYKEIVEQETPFTTGGKKQETSELTYALLGISDKLGEYRLTAVEPERLIFQQDGETVEKLLYDRNQNRVIMPSPRSDQQFRPVNTGTQSEKDHNKRERKPVVFSRRPGDKKTVQETERKMRIPFR